MKILIVGDEFGFPFGRATVHRVRDIAKGLQAHGVPVALLLTEPSEPHHNVRNHRVKGSVDNLPFLYTSGSTIIPSGLIGRRLLRFRGLIGCLLVIVGQRKRGNIAMILYVRHMVTVVVLGLACKFLRVPCVLELCEWPTALPSSSRYHAFRKWVFQHCAAAFVDGAIVISRFLADRMKGSCGGGRNSFKMLIVPILVDPNLFDTLRSDCERADATFPRFLFCGFLDHLEPIMFLLEVGAELKRRGQQFRLQIVGTAAEEHYADAIRERARVLGIAEAVTLTGFLQREDLLKLYRSATALLLPLEQGVRSEARFPTKLGEYLLSGRPVVVSRIGESTHYLEDRRSCMFVPPDDGGVFADVLQEVASSEALQERIGRLGAEVAKVAFNPDIHGAKISQFLRSLLRIDQDPGSEQVSPRGKTLKGQGASTP